MRGPRALGPDRMHITQDGVVFAHVSRAFKLVFKTNGKDEARRVTHCDTHVFTHDLEALRSPSISTEAKASVQRWIEPTDWKNTLDTSSCTWEETRSPTKSTLMPPAIQCKVGLVFYSRCRHIRKSEAARCDLILKFRPKVYSFLDSVTRKSSLVGCSKKLLRMGSVPERKRPRP